MFDKNSLLQVYQSYNWCTWSSKNHYPYGSVSQWHFQVNCHGSKLATYVKVLILIILLFRYQKRLFTAFYSQINSQIKKQNSIIYLRVFVNYKHNNWAKQLLIAECAYNNAKNMSTGHIIFELNYRYYLRALFKDVTNSCLRSYSANKLVKKLRELIDFCYQNLFHA